MNYRYLENELRYLLENSDTEILLFHGVLGDTWPRSGATCPTLKAIVQVDDGHPLVDGALRYQDLVAGHEPAARTQLSGDDLYILYTGGTTGMPKGVMWRNEDLYESLVPSGARPLRRGAPRGSRRLQPGRGRGRRRRPDPGPPPGVAADARHRVHELTPGAVRGRHDRDARVAQLRRGRAVARGRPRARHADGDRRRRVRQADGRALEEAEEDNAPYDLSTVGLVISSGVMWTAEIKQALMARGAFLCLDSLGSSEGVGFAQQISAPGAEATTAKFSIGAHTKVLTEDGREVAARLRRARPARPRGPIPLGYYKDPAKSAATFRTFGGKRYSIPATGRRSRPTARSSSSGAAASRSTRAARRSSPRRSRRR